MKSITSKAQEVKSTDNGVNKSALPFSRQNYLLMLVGIGLILVGFFIMTLDKEEFGFGFLGITLGPAITFIGFLFEFYAIFRKK
ncbi:DUF3098 domain-containing protein [Emticicia sp. BO119]|uniref:DUF3098 domain-containing protein n=1 Tax=Emticicia sp. BO119 TaxID=2757768 RepID=UPI0015F09B44|nr:DUF3098 domain-containing protein [Emticicia sp. BO119]MBA4850110.1 DUF3098 domain-containing protein [Emticicia sp. BO119]